MDNSEYIKERTIQLAGNINDFKVESLVKDLDGAICRISDKSINSIEIEIDKKKKDGIKCKQWFYITDFNKRFKVK